MANPVNLARRKRELESRLEGRQIQAALACVQRDFAETAERRTYDDIAAEAGVSRNSLYEWRTQNRDFIDYVNLLADGILESKRAEVYSQLMTLIGGKQPSVKAIDLFMRRFGLLTDHSVVENVSSVGLKQTPADIAESVAELDALLADDKREV